MKILLAVDGSPYTRKMLAWLSANDDFLAGAHQYTVLTVTPVIPPHAARLFQASELKAYYDDTAEAVFKPIRKFTARHNLATQYVGKTGNAGEVIAKVADKDKFDLVIMGSHGQSSLMNLVTGSVATKVLANSKVPVLLVR
ncbi:universal stress protein [Aquabacterium soli]|jgi:nucleotide-binding universal stress UspA family protein|uniref:Universal stress protein n=1 Tax=Aquabacterium soli TaxID=2493092 RepID=A0A3R8T0J8_9BURK|nr:universal stress protein [Aquabacterium soli]RRS03296.1 universal stress protein [Aquabacterium soli]